VKPKVFGLIDFTAGYHQTPLHPNSWAHTAFITHSGLYEWCRVAMGLKGSGPFFQRSIANKVLVGYVTNICEVHIDDVDFYVYDFHEDSVGDDETAIQLFLSLKSFKSDENMVKGLGTQSW